MSVVRVRSDSAWWTDQEAGPLPRIAFSWQTWEAQVPAFVCLQEQGELPSCDSLPRCPRTDALSAAFKGLYHSVDPVWFCTGWSALGTLPACQLPVVQSSSGLIRNHWNIWNYSAVHAIPRSDSRFELGGFGGFPSSSYLTWEFFQWYSKIPVL